MTVENTAELVRVVKVAAAAASAEGLVGGGGGGTAIRVSAHVSVEACANAARRIVSHAGRTASRACENFILSVH